MQGFTPRDLVHHQQQKSVTEIENSQPLPRKANNELRTLDALRENLSFLFFIKIEFEVYFYLR